MKLLVIEDEVNLCKAIVRYFKNIGYIVDHAHTFSEAFLKISNYLYDCVILDLNLPDRDGMQLVKICRENKYLAGLVILSAREGLEDKLRGFELGADDYLTKPFNLAELNARIRAVIRRKSDLADKIMELGDIEIHPDRREVRIRNTIVELTKKEYDILLFLARNKNRVVTKDSIAEYIWGEFMEEAISYDFMYAHVKNLRKKLASFGCGDYLRNIYGVGYKFIIP